MAKDSRQWMRFPIDMHRDMKVERLSDSAFRVFFEMNGEARLEGNDGVFERADAEFRWPVTDLRELCSSHPTSPLVILDGERYVIRVYAKHQLTEEDRERLAEIARANGQKGGRPRKNPETQKNPDITQSKPRRTQAKAESESESESEDLLLTESVSLGSNPREEIDGLTQTETEEQIQACRDSARRHRLDLDKIRELAKQHCARVIGFQAALLLGQHIIAKAPGRVRVPMSYVTGAFQSSPAEIQQWVDEEGHSP